jgi:hypothetical protein
MKHSASKHPESMPSSRRHFMASVCAASAAGVFAAGLDQSLQAGETKAIAVYGSPQQLARVQEVLGPYFILLNGMRDQKNFQNQSVVAVIGISSSSLLALKAMKASTAIQRAVIIESGSSDPSYQKAYNSLTQNLRRTQPMLVLNANNTTETFVWERTTLFLQFAIRPGSASSNLISSMKAKQLLNQQMNAGVMAKPQGNTFNRRR